DLAVGGPDRRALLHDRRLRALDPPRRRRRHRPRRRRDRPRPRRGRRTPRARALHGRRSRSGAHVALGPALRPLALPLFRTLWIAQLVSNLGTYMHSVAAVWLMTGLSRSPLLVALLSAAQSLPLFLLALLAGALGDAVDRRRYLVGTQLSIALAQGALGVVTLLGLATPSVLLWLTFAIGVASAMNAPVGQAVITDLVAAPELGSAIALNSVSVNVARAAGPALGGLLVAAANPGFVFLLNALTTL